MLQKSKHNGGPQVKHTEPALPPPGERGFGVYRFNQACAIIAAFFFFYLMHGKSMGE